MPELAPLTEAQKNALQNYSPTKGDVTKLKRILKHLEDAEKLYSSMSNAMQEYDQTVTNNNDKSVGWALRWGPDGADNILESLKGRRLPEHER